LLPFFNNLQSTLHSSGFNRASVAEVMQAMQVFVKYNIIDLVLSDGVAEMAQMRSVQETPRHDGGKQPPAVNFLLVDVLRSGSGAAANGKNFAETVMKEHRISNEAIELEVVDAFFITCLSDLKAQFTIILGNPDYGEKWKTRSKLVKKIPDTIVGAVLGPKAKTLQEIQFYSGFSVWLGMKKVCVCAN
uniref:CASPASE_P20 domain-containing protein n=1 Tax=Haemonchus placei TaxID=6290 RepID=A0A0N4WV85_HAEPC